MGVRFPPPPLCFEDVPAGQRGCDLRDQALRDPVLTQNVGGDSRRDRRPDPLSRLTAENAKPCGTRHLKPQLCPRRWAGLPRVNPFTFVWRERTSPRQLSTSRPWFEAMRVGDDAQVYAIALQLAARSARQGHQKAATELKELIEDARNKGRVLPSSVTAIAKPRGEIADLVTAAFPETHLRDLVAPESVVSAITQVISEQRQRHHLESNGFDPIHRLLLEGPPGTGKTMTAPVLATELSLPLLTIRLDAVLSKFLGETSSKLRVLFDGVAQQQAVYLFDEFDALGGHRAGMT